MMTSEMVWEGKPPRLERGRHLASDGMWLGGASKMLPVPGTATSNRLKEAFDQRRMILAHHLRVWREKNKMN